MSDVPTVHLRFVERTEHHDTIATWPHGERRTVKILQQLFHTRRGSEWRDVPVHKEASDE